MDFRRRSIEYHLSGMSDLLNKRQLEHLSQGFVILRYLVSDLQYFTLKFKNEKIRRPEDEFFYWE